MTRTSFTMRNNKISLSQELQILQFAGNSGNLGLLHGSLKFNRAKIGNGEIILKKLNCKLKTLLENYGPKLENKELGENIYLWMLCQWESELAVSTQNIVDKALSLEPMFHNDDAGKLKNWVYDFLKRRNLSMRTRIHKSQITESAIQSGKRDYCRNIMIPYCNLIGNPKYFLKIDETAVYLNFSPNRSVHPKREKTVSIMVGGSLSTRFTLAVTIATDGRQLLLFVILKRQIRWKCWRIS